MSRARRPLAIAVQLIRDAVIGEQVGDVDGGEWLMTRVRRALRQTTSRGDRERLVAHLSLLGASMAQRVPDAERERVFDELTSIAKLSPTDQEMLRELARFGMVA